MAWQPGRMTTDELWTWDATRLADAIRRREVSSTEATESVLGRIAARNPQLNAIVDDLSDLARTEAAAADAATARGDELGALHGVPVTVKVNIDYAGRATTNGLPALADFIAPGDSAVVANFRNAGAVIVGRTNTPEMSMRMTTHNPLHGRTYNPWHPDASPGGSSGGAGSAAAAGFGPIHHGNDIGGSLRFPAFCNGVATIKPTQGRIPSFSPSAAVERGLLATLMSCQGVIARSTADVRLGTEVLSAADPRDPWHVPAPFIGEPLAGPIRVAVTRNPHGHRIHPGIVAAIDTAAAHLTAAGYDVVEVEPPPVIEAMRGWFSTGITEMRLTMDAMLREYTSDEMQRVFDGYYAMGELLDLAGYRAGLSERTRMVREWSVFLDTYPLVLTPFLLCPTYGWNDDADGDDRVRDLFHSSMYSCGLNFLGLPAGVVPISLVEDLPAGVQLVGRRFREDVVLDAMEAIEKRNGRLVPQLWAQG